MASRIRFSKQDDAFIREHYRKRGARFCAEHLPGRTEASIISRARRIKAARPAEGLKRPTNDLIDAAIKRAYTGERHVGFVSRCAAQVGRTRTWVAKRALELGLIQSRDHRAWSEEEIEYAARFPLVSPVDLSKRMRRKGWHRTPAAIAYQRSVGRVGNSTDGFFTAAGLAEAMGVGTSKVTGWIKADLLKAERRGSARTEAQNGDGYVIHEREVARFVLRYPAHVSLTKLEPNKFWFLDLMARYAKPVSVARIQQPREAA